MRSAVLACSLALLAAGAAQAADEDEAFRIDKRDLKKEYETIALAPVDADPLLDLPEPVAAMLEQEVTARLQKEGFTVIPSRVLGDIRKAMEAQVGGYNDPATGEVDAARLQAVRTHAFREMWFRQDFDALATIRVTVSQVPMESDEVEWDGVKYDIEHKGRRKKYAANVAVSSVSLAMFDASDKPLYVYYGGLEPLMYRDDEQLLVYSKDKFFLDEKKIRKAVRTALDPF